MKLDEIEMTDIIVPPHGERLYRYAEAVLKLGFTQSDAAELFGVTEGTISQAVDRNRHKFNRQTTGANKGGR